MADNEDMTDMTVAKTLWTETILEILYEALRKGKDDATLIEVLKEVRMKGHKPGEIVDRVDRKVDKQAALRVKALLQKN